MFQIKRSGVVRVGARDGLNRIVSLHMRLFLHNNSEIPSYLMPFTIRYRIAKFIDTFASEIKQKTALTVGEFSADEVI